MKTGNVILKNADILTMNDGPVLKYGDLWIADGKILRVKETAKEKSANEKIV